MDKKEKNIVTFSADSIELIDDAKDVNDSQFCKARLTCFGSGTTSHGYNFSEEVIKDAEFSILGKAILFKYNIFTDDCEGHEEDEIPAGFVPLENANITYTQTDNGLMMTVDCYIWKLYSGKLCDILARTDGIKDVSVEMLLIETKENEDGKTTDVLKFVYTATTILGEKINPAKQGSNIEVVHFSEQKSEYMQAKEQFEKKLYNSSLVNQESLSQSDSDGSFLYCNKEQDKEVTMEKEVVNNSAENTPEVLENAEQVKTTNVSVSEYTDTYDDNGNFVSSESEYHDKSVTTVEQIPDTTEDTTNTEVNNADTEQVDNSCVKENNTEEEVVENSADKDTEEVDMSVKCSELELKCSQLESELTTLKNSFSTLELKCSTLEEYKNNKENELKLQSVECALNDVVDILSAEQVSQWRERSLQCSNVDQFKNELKAFAFDLQKQNGTKQVETLRNSIPLVETVEPTNVWDRLAKQL